MENKAGASTEACEYKLDVVGPLKEVAAEPGSDTAHEKMRSREHALQVVATGIARASGVPGGVWVFNTPRNSEGPPKNCANLNPIV